MATEKCPYCGSTKKCNDVGKDGEYYHCGNCGRLWKRGDTQASDYYKRGVIEGIKRFAWWKDGIQYVGATGKTLEEALDEIERRGA